MVASTQIRRGDVVLVNLEPTKGEEIQKTRPCVVVSPDEINAYLRTYIVAPMTTGGHSYPFRIACRFKGKTGHIVLDQSEPLTATDLSGRWDEFQTAYC